MRRRLQSSIGISARHMHGWEHKMVFRERFLRGENGWQWLNMGLHEPGGFASRHHIIGHDDA